MAEIFVTIKANGNVASFPFVSNREDEKDTDKYHRVADKAKKGGFLTSGQGLYVPKNYIRAVEKGKIGVKAGK